ncbi:MAG TPA: hypothetical protein VFN80_11210 [Acidothermaceae bacterium]|nr:hypothetical protein [Acidothermaceae bacterium]
MSLLPAAGTRALATRYRARRITAVTFPLAAVAGIANTRRHLRNGDRLLAVAAALRVLSASLTMASVMRAVMNERAARRGEVEG